MIPLILFALFAVGCAAAGYPKRGEQDFIIDDPLLAELWLQSAQEWTDAGLYVAALVTVNAGQSGIKVKWADAKNMPELCDRDPKDYPPEKGYIGACVTYTDDAKFGTLWIARESGADRERLRRVVMHEMIHAIVPTEDHLADDKVGIMHLHGNSSSITQDDMDFLRARTRVV